MPTPRWFLELFSTVYSHSQSLFLLSAIIFSASKWGQRFFISLRRSLSELSRASSVALLRVPLVSLLVGATYIAIIGVPNPSIHDEFCNLLTTDTFLHGRLTNPTHPLWRSFETFHIIHTPTYTSIFQPALALFMVFGKFFTGMPVVGVLLSTALACVALAWMLMAWVPVRWAILGGFLAAIHPLLLQWSGEYYGGGPVGLLGGALMCGAFARLRERPRWTATVLFLLGALILANHRPVEGGALFFFLFALLVLQYGGNKSGLRSDAIREILFPMIPGGLLIGAWLCFYNYRLTGDPWTLPRAFMLKRYSITPPFLWLPTGGPHDYSNNEMKSFFLQEEFGYYQNQHTGGGFIAYLVYYKLRTLFSEYLSPVVIALFPLVFLRMEFRKREWRWLIAGLLPSFSLFFLGYTWMHSYYVSSLAGVFFLMVVMGMRYVYVWRWKSCSIGKIMVHAIVLCMVMQASIFAIAGALRPDNFADQRNRMVEKLEGENSRYVVFVRYGPKHILGEEWVYNEANIDDSSIVWARDLGKEQNAKVIDYFKGRKFWILTVDDRPKSFVPYESSAEKPSAKVL